MTTPLDLVRCESPHCRYPHCACADVVRERSAIVTDLNARRVKRAESAADFLVALIMAILGAAALLHFLTPCEAGSLCMAAVIRPTRIGLWLRIRMAVRAWYLRTLIAACERDIEFHQQTAELAPELESAGPPAPRRAHMRADRLRAVHAQQLKDIAMNAPTELRQAVRPMGVYESMPFEEYHAVEAVSASGLRVFARSPWHYRNRVEIKPTRPMLRGSLVHCAQLEPDAMAARYVVVPEGAPKRPTAVQWAAKKSNESSEAAKDWWRDFEQRSSGLEIITAEEYAICQQQLRAIAAVPSLADLFARGKGEVSIFWIDPATKLYCKARLDWWQVEGKTSRIGEVKSTQDESPAAFGRTAARMKYELQRAHYIDAVRHGARLGVESFTFAAVTSQAPVLAVPYDLTDEMVSQAEDERAEHMERLAWCMKEDTWPAYGDGLVLLDYPAYAKRSSEVEVSFVED